MFVEQIEAAIAVASSSSLIELNRAIWCGLSSGALGDDDAQRLAELIHARQTLTKAANGSVGGPRRVGSLYPTRKPQRPPVRSVAVERRRRLAASGPMPPALAARFTTGELAVLRIVADQCRDHGRCTLPVDAIAARAGVGRTTCQRAIREAGRLGMLHVEERRQHGAPNLTNRITIVDREWRTWIERGALKGGGGFGKWNRTETRFSTEMIESGSSGQIRNTQPHRASPTITAQCRRGPA